MHTVNGDHTMVGWAEAAPPELGPAPMNVTGSLLSVSGFGTVIC